MIDLSHLTEEEQGAIMTVLRRDLELKKAEEERISKLEKVLSSSSQADARRKYLTGEWFYEAKSRRHMDKIHGSEIILASMKQRKAGSDGILKTKRSETMSSRGSDLVPPPKPARLLEALQPQEINNVTGKEVLATDREVNKKSNIDAEKENLNLGVRSPRTPRHNPFNRASLIVVEPPESNNDASTSRDQETPETEPIPPLKSPPAGDTSKTLGGSVTSEASSAGFRPVPKRRTFLSRRSSTQSGSSSLGIDAQGGSVKVVPAPRRSLQGGSSGSSIQSYLKGQDETPQQSVVSDKVSQSAQPSKSLDENSQLSPCDVSQVSSNSSLERDRLERNPPSLTRDRPATFKRSDASADREILLKRDELDDGTVVLHTGSVQDSDREHSVGSAMRQEELSLPRSTVDPDPPVSYDLIFIDKSDPQSQSKSNQKQMFKLSTQATSPTDDEDSIAKVLDWFSRSTNSTDWLNTEVAPKSSDKQIELSKIGREDSLRKDAGSVTSDRKRDAPEIKRSHSQNLNEEEELRAAERIGNKELRETEMVKKDTRDRMRSQESEDTNDENQVPQMSHLKSFWEKNNMGPKILIGKSVPSSQSGQKPAQLPVEEDKETANRSNEVSDTPPVTGIYNGKGTYVISSQEGAKDNIHLSRNQEVNSLLMNTSTQRKSDFVKLAASPQVRDRRGSETEILRVTRLNGEPRTSIQSRVSPESEIVSLIKPDPQPDSISQPKETPLQDELSKTIPVSLLDKNLQRRDSPDSEKLYLSKNSPYMDYKQGGNDLQITTKTQLRRGSGEDVKRRDSEDRNMQSSLSPKRKDDTTNKDRISSPPSNRHGLAHQESTAERIKQLKAFWEQERNKSVFYTKPKTAGDEKAARGVSQATLNKRFTKSEYDLRSVGSHPGSDEEDQENVTVPLNQRIEKSSTSLSTGRSQFNTLREFWDETTSDRGSSSSDKSKSPKRKEAINVQLQSQELEFGDPEIYREKTKPAVVKPFLSKSPHDRQSGLRAVNDSKNGLPNYMTAEQQRETKRSLKDSNREERSSKPQSSPGRETRSSKSRKDSFSNSSSRGNSMRRTTSMFTLSFPAEKDPVQLKTDVSPVHSQSRKQRQNTEKGAISRRSSEENEVLPPLARSCVPKDYRHYLGMTDKNSVHNSLAPAHKDEGSEGKSEYEFDMGGPVWASTPVSSEERYSRKGSKASQRPLWSNYSSTDTGPESSLSSTSDTWPNSRSSSNRENDDDNQNPVRKALRRAEARPRNLAKSMEDITGSLPTRQERRQDPSADMRRVSNVSSIPSNSSSLFSDPDHLKKMSKSVPSFLQEENAGKDTDSDGEDSYPRGRLMMGKSLTNLNRSPGMASRLSGSVMTMYSGDFGNVEVQGSIQFSINYIQKLREFHIFVAECRDLAAVDPKRGRSYPYVKSYLVPDKANLGKRKTSVKKKTLNPTFNEILRYRVRMEYLKTQTLILSVWHHDTFGRNSFLGEVDVDLSKWDFDHTQMNYLALKARSLPFLTLSNVRGEMRLAIRFLPPIIHSEGSSPEGSNTGEIHIWVKECKNLPLIRATIDPYVKCFVLPDRSRKSRQKTRVLRRTVDPVFNHTMVYDGIREADLTEACVELTVWDRDRLASNLLGGLRIGAGAGRSYGSAVDWMDSTPYEAALWERMKATPNEWVEDVLPLRMLNSAKTAFK